MARSQQYRELPFRDSYGRPFVYALPDAMLQGLDEVSRKAGGTLMAPELVTNSATRDRYLIHSLMEEAITSSQLEGAVTTRRDAKEMLRAGRPPRNKSERMIVNNYLAMQFVRENVGEALTPALVCELHRIVTEGTLRNPAAAGRPQLPSEQRVGVWSETDDVQLHEPPPAEQLPERLARLCSFANGETQERWMHPVLRAIVTHFMTGYDHYFEDGNGRTARALFYWVALRNNLWLLEFVAISRILRDAPVQYAKSYLHTEQDGGDVTYFALHQLSVICRAIDELHKYLSRKAGEMQAARSLVPDLSLNHRQLAVVEGALRNADLRITVSSHAASHDITAATARTDLRGLEDRGVLKSRKESRAQVWTPVHGLPEVLESAVENLRATVNGEHH
ncbi:MAG: Fic family protein [Propionibacteriaceae bacterium]|nr:Fic family protein [Propionibacteriaceae bacterium]